MLSGLYVQLDRNSPNSYGEREARWDQETKKDA